MCKPSCWFPSEKTSVIPWHGHIPFAFSLMRLLRPQCFVELGVHKGDSYLAFCEAVEVFWLPTRCFGIDTWKGDKHAGYYTQEVLDDLKARHDSKYSAFSHLVQSTFDEALALFQDASVDLLHIDGCHTYEAVHQDFHSWKSKLSAHGIVLFHDIAVHDSDFGVWKLWQELCEEYASFEFLHSNGLGVLAVGEKAESLLPDLFALEEDDASRLRSLYTMLGHSVAYHGLQALLAEEREHASQERERLNRILAERDEQIAALKKTSLGWKWTSLKRWVRRGVSLAVYNPRAVLFTLLRKSYAKLPVSVTTKRRLKKWFYNTFPFFWLIRQVRTWSGESHRSSA